MEIKIMDTTAVKTEKVKVLNVKLDAIKKQVKDLLCERAVIKICILDVTGLLSDIIETRESMITITVRKHVAEKLSPVFVMLHRLEGVLESSSIPKQGRDQHKKTSVKLIFKSESEPKGKEKLFSKEPIVDNGEDEELDESELKKRQAREVEMDENQRIVREAEAKEKVEKEDQVILESRNLLFPLWTLIEFRMKQWTHQVNIG
ncbi:unnamed protein product [Lactuca saligna]|uniref:Uncharacterized protein n=1 Tax=Lactuca saligna TaxID=75948 RepID=A0AA35ZVJ9_LACSI|nr:unnamed protein product [Lactuca saligna]